MDSTPPAPAHTKGAAQVASVAEGLKAKGDEVNAAIIGMVVEQLEALKPG